MRLDLNFDNKTRFILRKKDTTNIEANAGNICYLFIEVFDRQFRKDKAQAKILIEIKENK